MLLIHKFRTIWGTGKILSNDDVEFVRICFDVALSQAVQQGHTSTIYDMSPTVWACAGSFSMFLRVATRSGGWQVKPMQQLLRWSFAGMYVFLEAMHARGDRSYTCDPATRQVIHRYRLPFMLQGDERAAKGPRPVQVAARRQAAERLDDCGRVAAAAHRHHRASRADDRATAWARSRRVAPILLLRCGSASIGQTAGRYQFQSVAQGGGSCDDDADAEETRRVVGGVMGESRAAGR